MKKRILSLLTAIMIFVASSLTFYDVQAVVAIDDLEINSITFRKVHTGYEITGAFIEIWGAGLSGANVLFEDRIDGFVAGMGELEIDTTGLLRYTFTKAETINFGGRIAVEGTQIDLSLDSFPNFSDANQTVYNVDPPAETIELSGANLDGITGVDTVASYGNLEREYIDFDLDDTATKITITDPAVPGGILGEQTLSIEQNTTQVMDGSNSFEKRVVYVYYNAFRLTENLGIDHPQLFPNTGGKGDEFFITAENLNANRNYDVYFVTDVGQTLNDSIKAEPVSFLIDYEGDADRLSFTVPDGDLFEELEYILIITDTQNGSIIAQQVLDDTYSVVDATFLPTIEEIYPTEGPQEGADVQIDGRNIISLNVPDLDTSGVVTGMTQDSDGLHVRYENALYNGQEVEIRKDMITKIGGKATYLDDGSKILYAQGVFDSIFVHAPQADDAEEDPYKDVNIEITITITSTSADPAFKYVFNQVVNEKDGFKFIPSSMTPVIDSVVPDSIHVTGAVGNYLTGDDVMLVIDGDNFLVNRYTDGSGEVFVNYPMIFIKTLNDQALTNYDILLDPNAVIDGTRGIIYDMSNTIASGQNYMKNVDLSPYQLELKVVDDKGNTVTGTTGDDIGSRIIARIPRHAAIDFADFKNLLVVNPTRGSQEPGKKKIKVEAIKIVDTNDIPVIESVDPVIITVEGNEEITIIGNNFQEGAKIFLNGNRIQNFSREISQSGDKVILKFLAGPGPEGKSQIVIQNPSGAIATNDFYYVVSFNKDPKIDNFLPNSGTADTYVVINGENFLKEDPTVESLFGLDILRIIGSRVYLDNIDINEYNRDLENNIVSEDYFAPDVVSFIERDDIGQRIELTPFSENIYIKDDADNHYILSNDGEDNPVITDEVNTSYTFKYEVDRINIYDSNNHLLDRLEGNYTFAKASGGKSGTAVIKIDDKILTVYMDNNIIYVGEDAVGFRKPKLADYAESVVLISNTVPKEYFRLYADFDGTLVLTNGKDRSYEVIYFGGQLLAKKNNSEAFNISNITQNGFTVEEALPYTLTMSTVYKKNLHNRIFGKRTEVLNRTQIAIKIPALSSGKGYKDLKVLNPDTKYDEKVDDKGFYYIEQASSTPVITHIDPKEGSVDGGYVVKIDGSEFEENMSVYVDGVLVPAEDTSVDSAGTSVTIRMPTLEKDLANDYNVSHLDVPVVVMNNDGGNDSRPTGFRYVIPTSSPEINQILPTGGTTNGGAIVEIIGYEFRYFEPFDNFVGGPGYDLGDSFEDLYLDGVWNDLLDPNVPIGALTSNPFLPEHPYYDAYYTSPILPRVYFGEVEAKVVEFDTGYIKVITPPNTAGSADVYVVNNDSGVSNKLKYQYASSSPRITSIHPNFGKRQGLELRDIYGTDLFDNSFVGYKDDIDTAVVDLDDLDVSIRFSDISNRDIDRSLPNSGLINAQRSTVFLEGDLRVEYNGINNTLTMSVTEDGKIYNRVFNNYNDETAFLPMEMLKTDSGEYYHPASTDPSIHDGGTYEDLKFEYIKVEVFDKRFLVDRSYSTGSEFKSSTHVVVTTPSYYTVGEVNVLFTNPDGGQATIKFDYTFPDSLPKIYDITPRETSPDESKWYTKRTVNGGTQIQVRGLDFRDNVKALIGSHTANIAEKTRVDEMVDGVLVTFDLLILDVPAGALNEVGLELPIIITNTDYGVANSSNAVDIFGSDKRPMFFVYQKPLSSPVITRVLPPETSQYGNKTITLIGTDFREGATVTIGSKGGVPIVETKVLDSGTRLTFLTPKDTLVPGTKKIQIENKDYGTSDFTQSIDIISYPIVEDEVTFENGKTVDWVTVEGGTKIVLRGDNFYPNAKVVIGGRRVLSFEDQTPGQQGLYKDDQYYTIIDGIIATEVEYVSAHELIVTTPEILLEDTYTITVINADGGLSEDNAKVFYSVPVPSEPVGLKLELIANRYIRISEYTASDHNYYEIYYFVGSKSPKIIENNAYQDMKYLGSTDIEPYRIPSINAVEHIRENQMLIIGLKAVNKFGSSDWSNLEYLTYEELKDVVELGDPDIDGDIGVPDGVDHISDIIGTELITTFSEKHLDPYIVVDLTTPEYDRVNERVINIPGNMIESNTSIIRVDYDDINIMFTPISLNTEAFRTLYFIENAYGRIETSDIEDAYSGYMIGQIPRGYKVASKVITIAFNSQNNHETKIIDRLSGAMDLVLEYDPLIVSGYSESKIKMFRFNVHVNQWIELDFILDTETNRITTRTSQPGSYILLLER